VFITAKQHRNHVGAQIQSQCSQCGICGGKYDTDMGSILRGFSLRLAILFYKWFKFTFHLLTTEAI